MGRGTPSLNTTPSSFYDQGKIIYNDILLHKSLVPCSRRVQKTLERIPQFQTLSLLLKKRNQHYKTLYKQKVSFNSLCTLLLISFHYCLFNRVHYHHHHRHYYQFNSTLCLQKINVQIVDM